MKQSFCIMKPQEMKQVPLSVKDFLSLTKFSLSNSNAILTSFCYCYILEDYPSLQWTGLVYASSLTMAMSTQVFNQILEWKQDKVMTRTCNRPIPKRKISTFHALLCGLALFGISNTLLYQVNGMAT